MLNSNNLAIRRETSFAINSTPFSLQRERVKINWKASQRGKVWYRSRFEKFPQERTKFSLSRCLVSLACKKLAGSLVPLRLSSVRVDRRPCSHRSRIMYRYLIYLCDRTRCQSIRRGTGLKQPGGEERLVIDFLDVEREFCLAGKSFPLLSAYPWNLIEEQFAVGTVTTLTRSTILDQHPLQTTIFVEDWEGNDQIFGKQRRIGPRTFFFQFLLWNFSSIIVQGNERVKSCQTNEIFKLESFIKIFPII